MSAASKAAAEESASPCRPAQKGRRSRRHGGGYRSGRPLEGPGPSTASPRRARRLLPLRSCAPPAPVPAHFPPEAAGRLRFARRLMTRGRTGSSLALGGAAQPWPGQRSGGGGGVRVAWKCGARTAARSLAPPRLGMRPAPPPWLLRWALCLALGHLPAGGGFVLHLEADCPLGADGGVLWANWTLAFNKVPFLCYDDQFRGFVPCGLGLYDPWYAVILNISDTLNRRYPDHGQVQREACREQTRSLWARTGRRQTPPNVRVFPVTPQNTPAPLMLACVAWGFFPAQVSVSWLKNGRPVQEHVGEPELSSNGDWTYQARLTLPVSPRQGDVYSCRVAHASLPGPITKDWAPGLPLELRAIVGAAAAVLGAGIAVLLAGAICWRKRVPAGYIPIDGNTYSAGRT
ncbi:class II histocompatibility antigen, M beta 1 chain [Tiliqua scincoides]|uniref:class II histocompatibility antigen, M beta 1 chain n=1 Tax=Tiliqua scincoides TaxID=71010 RepID=UPI003462B7E3